MHRLSRLALSGTAATALAVTGSLSSVHVASASSPSLPFATHIMKTLGANNELPIVGGVPAIPGGAGVPLSYHNGPVMVTNHTYAIFWEPAGHASSPTYQPLVKRFFSDVGGSALFNTTTEYYQTVNGPQEKIQNSSTFGGSYVDTTPFPSGGVGDADVRAAVLRAIAANNWPTGVSNEYFVYSGPGGEPVSSFCAYHGTFTTSTGANVIYADEPYGGQSGCTVPSSPNNDPAADSIINTTSHELWESITDPLVNVSSGWYALDGNEGSDQCNFEFGPTDAAGGDAVMNGHEYIVQEEWRNSGLGIGCVMS